MKAVDSLTKSSLLCLILPSIFSALQNSSSTELTSVCDQRREKIKGMVIFQSYRVIFNARYSVCLHGLVCYKTQDIQKTSMHVKLISVCVVLKLCKSISFFFPPEEMLPIILCGCSDLVLRSTANGFSVLVLLQRGFWIGLKSLHARNARFMLYSQPASSLNVLGDIKLKVRASIT